MARSRKTNTLIRNTLEAAMAAGLKVGAIEVTPDGTVRVLSKDAVSDQTVNPADLIDMRGT